MRYESDSYGPLSSAPGLHRGDRGVPSRSVDKVRGVPRRPPMRADTIPDFEGMRGGTGSRARPVPRAGWFCPGVRDSQRFPVGNHRGRMKQSEIRTPGDSVAAGSRGPATTLYEGSRLVRQVRPYFLPGRARGLPRSRSRRSSESGLPSFVLPSRCSITLR